MDAYVLSKYQNDEVMNFFIEYSLNKEKFISEIDKDFLILSEEIKDRNDFWKLKATFPHNIVVENDPGKSKFLMDLRQKILMKEHRDPVKRNTKIQLLGTIYPNQTNDFFILRIPDFMKNSGKMVPVDWELKGLVLHLWENGFPTSGWDAYKEENTAFINCAFDEFKDFDEEDPKYNMKDFYDRLKKFSGKYDFISMKYTDLQNIYKYFSLDFPDHNKALKGGLIPYWR